MRIGNKEISGFAALAPMAGVADRAMREICVRFGAAFTVGELTSAKGITLNDKKSASLLTCSERERPFASQIFGSVPEIMADAARAAVRFSPDFIDINMGCPAPKVAGNGGGSALMKDPELAADIVKAVVNAVNVPITVKMRTGYDNDSINAPELAKRCEAAGAAAVTVHGRTRSQMYAPGIDYKTIEKVKNSVKIPVINIVAETAAYLKSQGVKKVGIMATSGTIATKLFQDALKREGIEYATPSEDGQKKVMHLIYNNVKAGLPVEMKL